MRLRRRWRSDLGNWRNAIGRYPIQYNGFPAQYRQGALIVGAILCVTSLVLIVSNIVRPKTPFEWEHARAEAANPPWLSVQIDTADHRRKYRAGQPIKITAHFRSTSLYKYKIEIAEDWSTTTFGDQLHISNGQKAPLRGYVGVVCCGSRLVGLDDEGYSPARTNLNLKPGSYEIYLSTRRIFNWDDVGEEEYSASSFEVTSNVIGLRVVP
jgi:hypothetical protein